MTITPMITFHLWLFLVAYLQVSEAIVELKSLNVLPKHLLLKKQLRLLLMIWNQKVSCIIVIIQNLLYRDPPEAAEEYYLQ